MDYGVTITRGAAPWQIFQQGPDGTACIRLEGKYHLVHLSQELPLQFSSDASSSSSSSLDPPLLYSFQRAVKVTSFSGIVKFPAVSVTSVLVQPVNT